MIKIYYRLTKPGIVYGNLITAAAGFLLASAGMIDLFLFVKTILGLGFVMASSCVVNNYIDRDIDSKMIRTKNRAFPLNKVSKEKGFAFSATLLIMGCVFLLQTNILALIIALIGFFFYTVLYSIGKRKTTYGTMIGSVSGAVPPIVGYTAVSGVLDLGAFLLFLILVLWQMPHFYSISIFRYNDYQAAGLPVLPVKKNITTAKKHIFYYVVAFTISLSLFTVFGYTGWAFFLSTTILGIMWIIKSLNGFDAKDNVLWAKGMFRFSLIVILGFSIMVSIDAIPRF